MDDYQSKVKSAAHNDPLLVEVVHAYLCEVMDREFVPIKLIKRFFVAAYSRGEQWLKLDNEVRNAIDDILRWAAISPIVMSNIVRTYERAIPELEAKQRSGMVTRSAAAMISRLHGGDRAALQYRVMELYFQKGLSYRELSDLVKRIEKLSLDEATAVLQEMGGGDVGFSRRMGDDGVALVNRLLDGELSEDDISSMSVVELAEAMEILQPAIDNANANYEAIRTEVRERLL